MSLEAGSKLGPYEILARLGSGGMGEVYRARDSRLAREVAIKTLPADLTRNPDALPRFEREARHVAAIPHPNIVVLHDLTIDRDICFAVLELLDGETLRDRIRNGAIPWESAAAIAAAVAEGLSAAHAKGVIHRDLKPDNIFLTSDGRIKILDFGLARTGPVQWSGEGTAPYVPNLTGVGTVLGTLGYMSPEQVRGEPVDARGDLFALGCVLYEMLTGRQAFVAATPAETLAAVLKEDPPDSARSAPDAPPALHCIAAR